MIDLEDANRLVHAVSAPAAKWMVHEVCVGPLNAWAAKRTRGVNRSLSGASLPLSPPGWRDIVITVGAGGWAAGWPGNCGTHISVTAWRISSIRSSVELSGPVVMHRYGHLPHMGLPMGQKHVKFATDWVQILRNAYLWNCWMDLAQF